MVGKSDWDKIKRMLLLHVEGKKIELKCPGRKQMYLIIINKKVSILFDR